jgi:hypothetical protein
MAGIPFSLSREFYERVGHEKKWPTRFPRIGHSPVTVKKDRYHLTAILALPYLAVPCIISGKTLENNKLRSKEY